MNDQRKTICSRCAHLQVCRFAEKLKIAQKAVDELEVSFEDHQSIKLRDLVWIRTTDLICNNFLEDRFNKTERSNIIR